MDVLTAFKRFPSLSTTTTFLHISVQAIYDTRCSTHIDRHDMLSHWDGVDWDGMRVLYGVDRAV